MPMRSPVSQLRKKDTGTATRAVTPMKMASISRPTQRCTLRVSVKFSRRELR